MPVDVLGYLFAATVAAGGTMGYIKAGSVASIVAGLTFGGFLGFGAHMNSRTPPEPILQFVVSLLLFGMMARRWSKSRKLMPAGVISILACASLIRNVIVYNKYLPILGQQ